MQTTLLFFDDHALAVRDSVIRGVGRPTLILEPVWHDDPRLRPAEHGEGRTAIRKP